jgi:hypothetical protein
MAPFPCSPIPSSSVSGLINAAVLKRKTSSSCSKHAGQLAAHLGKTLPVLGSYSLADETPVPPPRPQRAISFAA